MTETRFINCQCCEKNASIFSFFFFFFFFFFFPEPHNSRKDEAEAEPAEEERESALSLLNEETQILATPPTCPTANATP